jgi:pimeloyl-ACP methyl ester carboxylesterase
MKVAVDHVVRLRDGRSMGYAQFGAADGFVVVNAHGGLACRLDVAAVDDAATANGVRLISPDRPGVGLSDPAVVCTVLEWARDVGDLLDQRGVEKFAVMGWSWAGNTRRRSLTACASA